jgi:hypothetical protein
MSYRLNIKPKTLFLIDAVGAMLSAFMLGVVLAAFENEIGMLNGTLYKLSILAVLFSIYSWICYLRMPVNWQLFMKIIGIVNLVYCGLTVFLCLVHFQEITFLGLMYFPLEVLILVFLALLELKTSKGI